MLRGDVERIKGELDKTPHGMSFTVWGRAVAELSAGEIWELSIRAGRRKIQEAEDRGLPIFQYGTGKQIGRAGEKKKK